MHINLKELEKKFHSDGYRLGMQALGSKHSEQDFYVHLQQLHLMVDEVVDTFTKFAERHNRLPSCKKGCSWCCYQPVFALSYELDYLHEYLKINFRTAELEVIYKRAALKRNKVVGLTGKELLASKFPCPLLEDDSCRAHAARPVACRIYLSSNVGSCIKFYEEPKNKNAVPELLDFPMRMGRMINEGFSAALKTGGIQIAEFKIEEFNTRISQY